VAHGCGLLPRNGALRLGDGDPEWNASSAVTKLSRRQARHDAGVPAQGCRPPEPPHWSCGFRMIGRAVEKNTVLFIMIVAPLVLRLRLRKRPWRRLTARGGSDRFDLRTTRWGLTGATFPGSRSGPGRVAVARYANRVSPCVSQAAMGPPAHWSSRRPCPGAWDGLLLHRWLRHIQDDP
jgi:hypothetical protein